MQHTKLQLTVDPESWHVDPDGAIVVDTADMLLIFPQTRGGADLIAERIWTGLDSTAETTVGDIDWAVGHIDDAPASAAWPATSNLLGELSEIRRTLTDTVTDLRSVLDPTRPAA